MVKEHKMHIITVISERASLKSGQFKEHISDGSRDVNWSNQKKMLQSENTNKWRRPLRESSGTEYS